MSTAAGEAKMPDPVGHVSCSNPFEMDMRILTYDDTDKKREAIEGVELTGKCW